MERLLCNGSAEVDSFSGITKLADAWFVWSILDNTTWLIWNKKTLFISHQEYNLNHLFTGIFSVALQAVCSCRAQVGSEDCGFNASQVGVVSALSRSFSLPLCNTKHPFSVRCPPSVEASGGATAGGSWISPSWTARRRTRPTLAQEDGRWEHIFCLPPCSVAGMVPTWHKSDCCWKKVAPSVCYLLHETCSATVSWALSRILSPNSVTEVPYCCAAQWYATSHCKITTWVTWVYECLEVWRVWMVTLSWLSSKSKKRQSYGTLYAEALNTAIFPVIWITKLLLPHIYLLFFMVSEQLSFFQKKRF